MATQVRYYISYSHGSQRRNKFTWRLGKVLKIKTPPPTVGIHRDLRVGIKVRRYYRMRSKLTFSRRSDRHFNVTNGC